MEKKETQTLYWNNRSWAKRNIFSMMMLESPDCRSKQGPHLQQSFSGNGMHANIHWDTYCLGREWAARRETWTHWTWSLGSTQSNGDSNGTTCRPQRTADTRRHVPGLREVFGRGSTENVTAKLNLKQARTVLAKCGSGAGWLSKETRMALWAHVEGQTKLTQQAGPCPHWGRAHCKGIQGVTTFDVTFRKSHLATA